MINKNQVQYLVSYYLIYHYYKYKYHIENMDLSTVLFVFSLPFVLLTAYFGTKNDFYDSDNYKGDGCAHDVKR